VKKCARCGNLQAVSDRFCENCGGELAAVAEQDVSLTPAPRVPSRAPFVPTAAHTPFSRRGRWNVLAIVALVCGVLSISLAAIIVGHIALRRIATSGERGRGLAIAALVFGYIVFTFWTVSIVGVAISAGVNRT
jgi:peptidyl-prolyl cis-trans isomerase B (cyclophilin B)